MDDVTAVEPTVGTGEASAEERVHAAEATAQALQSFLHAAVHELRTPVTTLKGTAQLARRRLERGEVDAARLARAMRVIDEQTDRLTRLLAQLIEAASIARGQTVLVRADMDVREVVQEVVQEVQADVTAPPVALAEAAGAAGAAGPLVINADAKKLKLALMALVESVARYAPGEPISVELGVVTPGPDSAGAGAQVTIRSAGPGIPAEDRDLLVGDPRRVVAGLGRAAGLGLYLCRQVVSLHGGRISLGTHGAGMDGAAAAGEAEEPGDHRPYVVVVLPLRSAAPGPARRADTTL